MWAWCSLQPSRELVSMGTQAPPGDAELLALQGEEAP